MFLTSSELEDFQTRCRSELAPQADSQLEAVAQATARMLADIDQVAVDDSSSVADIVVVAELAADTVAADTEAAAGIVQRQDMDKYSSCVDY